MVFEITAERVRAEFRSLKLSIPFIFLCLIENVHSGGEEFSRI